ncbi:NMT1/THI5 like family protein, partial [Chlamydia psittaci 84-8471/1]
PQLFG